MVKSTFPRSMPYVFEEEGGYSDNPADPGGATNLGITINTLSAWEGHRVTASAVKALTAQTANKIYQTEFWNKISADQLPAGVDYAIFDFAINSGPARAARVLQQVVGVHPDGVIGAQTIAAVNRRSPASIINAVSDIRLSWLKTLTGARIFGTGWAARVERVRTRALALARNTVPERQIAIATTGIKARQNTASLASIVQKPEAWAPIASVVSGIGALLIDNVIVQIALAALMIGLAGLGIWHFIHRVRSDP
ncbi:glycoside hydrolase family 108 protein [Paraburkholderia aspalathi]|nr:glycoside hydrolase family 108 protein [Paraburkholderia aspalathi]